MPFKLTIAVPVYNRVNYIIKNLKSIINQVTEEVEILVVDNASDDGTYEAIVELIKINSCIKLLRNKNNLGADGNFLRCYQEANGEYVMLLGSDDNLCEGAVQSILDCIHSSNAPDIVMLNFNLFSNDQKNTYSYLSHESGLFTRDRNVFMSYAKSMITFISCVVIRTSLINSVENPEKYKGTYFIHTCMLFEASKDKNTSFGIIFTPCVDANITPGNGSVEESFEVFGKWMKYVFCDVASKFNYDYKKQYSMFCEFAKQNWRHWLISSDVNNNKKKRKMFWKYGFPCIKGSFSSIIFIAPFALIPSEFMGILVHIKRKFINKR